MTKQNGSHAFFKASSGAIAILALLCILVAANAIVGRIRVRADMTEENLYTLSEGSKSLLDKLDRPVTLKLFFNGSNPQVPVHLKHYADRVEDLLREYRQAGGGNVRIEVYDPEPDSEAEEWARRYGIAEQPMGLMGPSLYFGVVAVMGDNEAILPALDPRTESMLEYNLTRLVHRVANPEKPIIGVIGTLPVLGTQPMPFAMPNQPGAQKAWVAFENLKPDYTFRTIDPGAEQLDANLDAVIVIHPRDLPEKTRFAIDQYLMQGGHLLVFVDPLSVMDMQSAPPTQFGPPRAASNLDPLLDTWGLRYDPGKVLADIAAASRVRAGGGRVEESPVWLSLHPTQIDRKHNLTAGLESLMMPYAGAFIDETSDSLEVTPLVRASDNAGLVGAMSTQLGTQAVLRELTRSPEPLNIAVLVNGVFETAFPEGIAEQTDAEAADTAAVPPGLQSGEGIVILVADVDFLYDDFSVQPISFFGQTAYQPVNDNITLLANAVELLSGSSDLIAIRSRGKTIRPFERVMELERRARQVWKDRETALVKSLEDAQRQLRDLQARKDASQRFILSEEQRQAIETFQEKERRIQDELKAVRKKLRQDIEQLGIVVKVLNIALVPALVALFGIGFGIYRGKRQ